MNGLINQFFGMCNNCAKQRKVYGSDYCGRTCAAEAAEKMKRADAGRGSGGRGGATSYQRYNRNDFPSVSGSYASAAADPQSAPVPRSRAPTPASESGFIYQSAAQEKARLAAVNQGALNLPQSGGSNAPQVVPAPNTMPGVFADADSSGHPPPAYGEAGAVGAAMPHAVYQSNLASPGPGYFYMHTTQAGFVPIPNPPPPGTNSFILGANGNFYPAPIATATAAYSPIPISVLNQVGAANQGPLSTPAPDPATAALRAIINPDTRGSPLGLRSPHARIDDEDDDTVMEIKTPLPKPLDISDTRSTHPSTSAGGVGGPGVTQEKTAGTWQTPMFTDLPQPPDRSFRGTARANIEAQPQCKLTGCKRTLNGNEEYCSQDHAQEAVRRGKAQACPVCHVNPVTSGFKHCSRDCAIKQAKQPKMNRLSRSRPSDSVPPPFGVPPSPPSPSPSNRGSLPTPPGPYNSIDKDADAPISAGHGTCEHCSTKPKQVNPGISKTYSCCGCTIIVPSGSPPLECPICKLTEVKKELETEKAKPSIVILPTPTSQTKPAQTSSVTWSAVPVQQPNAPTPAPKPATPQPDPPKPRVKPPVQPTRRQLDEEDDDEDDDDMDFFVRQPDPPPEGIPTHHCG